MSIVENVTEAEVDSLRRIIIQQANKIVALQNKIRVREQDFASAKTELQEKAFSLNTLPNDKVEFTQFLCREMCLIQWGVGLN